MSFRKIALSLVPLLLWCCSAFGQMSNNYGTSLNWTVLDTFVQCPASVPASNCFHGYTGAPAFSSIAAGVDGEVYGVSTGSVYYFDRPTNSFVLKASPSSLIKKVAVGNSQAVYALVGCASGQQGCNKIYKYNASANTWSQVASSLWFTDVSVGYDGDLWAISNTAYGCGSRVYHYNTSTSTFDAQAVGLSQLSVVSANIVWGVCAAQSGNNTFVWQNDSSGWLLQSVHFLQVSATLDGIDVFGIGNGNTFLLLNADGSTQQITNAAPTLIASGNANNTYALFGSTLKKFERFTLGVSYTLSGAATCGNPSLCGTTQHTGTAHLQLTGHAKLYGSQAVIYSSNISVPLVDTFQPGEVSDCIEGTETGGQLDCSISATVDSIVTCPMMGTIFTEAVTSGGSGGSLMSKYFETAYTLAKYTGSSNFCSIDSVNGQSIMRCNWSATPWCTAATTPPDHNITYVRDYVPVYQPTYWDTWQACVRVPASAPWHCSPINYRNALKINGPGITDTYPKADCTHNP